jgi:hypothetical protein
MTVLRMRVVVAHNIVAITVELLNPCDLQFFLTRVAPVFFDGGLIAGSVASMPDPGPIDDRGAMRVHN